MKHTALQTVKRTLDSAAISYSTYEIPVDHVGLMVNSDVARRDKKIIMVFTKDGELVSMEPYNS